MPKTTQDEVPADGLRSPCELFKDLVQQLTGLRARWKAEVAHVRQRREAEKRDPAKRVRRTICTGLGIFATFFLGTLVIDWLAPFGIDDATKAHSRQITGHVAAPFYRSAAQDRIAVVLINEASLDARGEPWPPRYAFYESVLRRIIWQSPRSIYLDILTADHRTYDDTLEAARAGIATETAQAGVPLFLGVVAERESSVFADIPEISMVSAGWAGFGGSYPLRVREDEPGAMSPAYALYREACLDADSICDPEVPLLPDDEARTAMSLVWGWARPAVKASMVPWLGECVVPDDAPISRMARLEAAFGGAWDELLGGFFEGRLDANREMCPPVLTIQEHQLDDPDVAALLAGRIVLVGTKLAALDDSVVSPVHRRLPGVYLHAMALDNLMTYGADRFREDKPRQRWIAFVIAVAVSLLIALTWRSVGGLGRRLGLLGVALAAVLASFLLQYFFRLPAFDWIGTTMLFLVVIFAVSSRYTESPEAPATEEAR